MDHHPESRPMGRKVYVGGLGNSGTVREIGDAFCCYGPLKNVWVARNPPGFAFVDFQDPRDAQNAIRALNGTILCGRRVRVALANRNSRPAPRGQSRNAPTRNVMQRSCYACGEIGHYARDCIVRHVALLGLDDVLEIDLDSSYYDSDDEFEMFQELYMDNPFRFYEYLQDRYGDSPDSDQETPNRYSGRSAQQQRRNERPQEQHRNGRNQRQRRNDRSQEQYTNNGSQEQSRNDRPQEQCRNNSTSSCSPNPNKTNNASDEVKCVICLDTVDDEMEYIPCGHGFHAKCCNEWLSINDICPVCRTEVGSRIGIAQICPVS